MVDVICN